MEKSTSRLCGHIIAGDISTGLAYIIPAQSTFAQIASQLKCRVDILQADEHQIKHALDRRLSLTTSGQDTGNGRKTEETPLPRDWEVDTPMTGTTDLEQTVEYRVQREASPSSESLTGSRPALVPSTMAIGSWKDQVRDRERDRYKHTQVASARTNEYFVPGDGIDREVITADICRYLGNDALVRPGNYEVDMQLFAKLETMLTNLGRTLKPEGFSKDISSLLIEISRQ